MRYFIDLIAEAQDTVLLYRGDATKIDQFDVAKTDGYALFGKGVYLTDNPKVARDYFNKGAGSVLFGNREGEESKTKAQLISKYLWSFISLDPDKRGRGNNAEYEAASEAYVTKMRERMNDTWSIEDRNERQLAQDALRTEYDAGAQQLQRVFLRQAQEKLRADLPNLTIMRNTQGEYLLRTREAGYITAFSMPKALLARTLDAEAPMPDPVIGAVKEAYAESGRPAMPAHFADWAARYRAAPIRKSFGNGVMFGGTGENPSLDDLVYGTDFGIGIMNDRDGFSHSFVGKLKAMGYIGFRYKGGHRTAGVPHSAYSIWDHDNVNPYRVKVSVARLRQANIDPAKYSPLADVE